MSSDELLRISPMSNITYLPFNQIDTVALMQVLNEDSIRTHLVDHPYFDADSINSWIESKLDIDAQPGSRIRAVMVDDQLAGWSGIQPDDAGFELAIVIAQPFWGCGITIFKTLMSWAKELGHCEVLFHLLDSRREYKALTKMASRTETTQLLGRRFTTYYFSLAT